MNYRIDHIPLTRALHRPGTKMTPTTLTIHSTGNPKSTAANEHNNLKYNSARQASFHVVVDAKEAIECIPLNEIAWHAGNAKGNRTSIGLEICESGDREKTLAHAAEVAAYILNKFGWGIDKMVQHYDWSRKNCPRILRDTGRWPEFVNMVEECMMPRYKTLQDVPDWGRQSVKWRMDAGIIKGDPAKGLNLTEDMVRMLVYFDREAEHKKR